MDAGLSQEELGSRAESGRTFVGELERGLKSPTIRTLFRLAEVLGESPSAIVQKIEAQAANGKR